MRRKFWSAALAALLVAVVATDAAAQNYPARQVRMITGSPLGGGADFLARAITSELKTMWGQPVVVEPRTGAYMSIAVLATVNSPADGYTLLFLTSSVLGMAMHPELPVDLERDLAPVSIVAEGPILLVVK